MLFKPEDPKPGLTLEEQVGVVSAKAKDISIIAGKAAYTPIALIVITLMYSAASEGSKPDTIWDAYEQILDLIWNEPGKELKSHYVNLSGQSLIRY
ncbi:hypothetical protein GOV09_00915 [Candidatus Woesearchaeota archaeon]|nr:hypothetical protein [Candidatus Woesearchaeota archaeon]